MVKTRALWLLPSALADMYDDAVLFLDTYSVDDNCVQPVCRLLQDPNGGSQFAVPDGAFKNDTGLLSRDQELYTDDGIENTYELRGASQMGCNDEHIRIIALYKTVAFYLTEAHSNQEKAVNDVKATLETLATPIAGVDLYLNYLDLNDRVAQYTTGADVVRAGSNSFHFSGSKSQAAYDELKDNRDLAQGRRYSANFNALISNEVIHSGLAKYEDRLVCDFSGFEDFSPDDEMDVAAWNVISTHLGDCKASLEQLQQQLSVQITDPLTAPQKPLGNGSPKPEDALGRLDFWDWDQARFGDLLDLQKCVNFVHPSPYRNDDDHLLDLVTAKVASLLPALKLENLPKIRAMLNIGFDLTSNDWGEALQKMSAIDQQKQEAQYAWQKAQTLKHFTDLYGGWAAQQATKDSESRTAAQIIESYAFPAPKPIKADPVAGLGLVKEPSADQILS